MNVARLWRAGLPVGIVWLLCLWCSTAYGHQSSTSYVNLSPDAERQSIDFDIRLSHRDLFEALGLEEDRAATAEEIDAGSEKLSSYVMAKISLESELSKCSWKLLGSRAVQEGELFAELRGRLSCSEKIDEAIFRYNLFFDLDPRHECYVRIGERLERLSADSSELYLDLKKEQTWLEQGWGFLLAGFMHVLGGMDHLLFLLGLSIVAVRRPPPLGYGASVASLFGIGHTIALLLAAFASLSVPASIVEPGIALSILFVGYENQYFTESRKGRWIALLFGIVHGLGFARSLKPLIGDESPLIPLLGFNLGIDLVQVAIALSLIPCTIFLCRKLGREKYDRWIVLPTSCLLYAVGSFWLADRLGLF